MDPFENFDDEIAEDGNTQPDNDINNNNNNSSSSSSNNVKKQTSRIAFLDARKSSSLSSIKKDDNTSNKSSKGPKDRDIDDQEDDYYKKDKSNSIAANGSINLDTSASKSDGMTAATFRDKEGVYIWGTNIKVKDVQLKFRVFIQSFKIKKSTIDSAQYGDDDDPMDMDDDDNSSKKKKKKAVDSEEEEEAVQFYMAKLRALKETGGNHMNINMKYVYQFDKSLYHIWIRYPVEVIPLLDQEINDIFQILYPDVKDDATGIANQEIELHPFNLLNPKPMRQLNPSDIDQMIAIRGLIIRTSPLIPVLETGFFLCSVCEFSVETEVINKKIAEPTRCPNQSCKVQGNMKMVHNRCTFTDKQFIKLQETPDAIPEGETPHTVSLFVYKDLIDIGKPGDRVEITGVFKANASRASGSNKSLRSIYKTYIDVVYIKKVDKTENDDQSVLRESGTNSELADIDEFNVSQEREQELINLSQRSDIYDLVTRSLAPSIWEMEDVKKGILCQLFGGSNKNFQAQGGSKIRGDINILMCGDPGTSKSQMLSFVHKIAPRGIYTSGKGSSAVGLTAYIAHDPDTRETVLESGALVLSDQGVCCIDEFDKMSDHTRSILHEVMEQQTVSVAKAGIICSLNARTSILASANPKESRYNPKISVVENIQLPPTLLSRFDLIYLVLDKADEKSDRMLSRHIVSMYWNQKPVPQWTMPKSLLSDYISYARKNIHPVIDDDAVELLVSGYLEMRAKGGKKTISATPRQLESLIRIAEAHAKIRYSAHVEPLDVAEAIRLVKSALQQVAIDPTTGTIDMDLINTGRSASRRESIEKMKEAILHVMADRKQNWFEDQLLRELNQLKINDGNNFNKNKESGEGFSGLDMGCLADAIRQLGEEEEIKISLTTPPTYSLIRD